MYVPRYAKGVRGEDATLDIFVPSSVDVRGKELSACHLGPVSALLLTSLPYFYVAFSPQTSYCAQGKRKSRQAFQDSYNRTLTKTRYK